MAKRIRLEIDRLKVERDRKRWNILFILATEDPQNPSKTVKTTFPSNPISLRRNDNNEVNFEAEGNGETNGMFALDDSTKEPKTLRTEATVKARFSVLILYFKQPSNSLFTDDKTQFNEFFKSVCRVLRSIGPSLGISTF